MPCHIKILEKVWDIKFEYLLTTVLDPSPLIRLSTSETKFVRNSLTQCGFIMNFEKSVWEPQKDITYK